MLKVFGHFMVVFVHLYRLTEAGTMGGASVGHVDWLFKVHDIRDKLHNSSA